MPGCVNTTEMDIKKAYRRGASSHGSGSAGAALSNNPVEQINRLITLRKQKLERRTIKVSKAAESWVSHLNLPPDYLNFGQSTHRFSSPCRLISYYEQYSEFDYFLTSPELPNPWQTDNTELWDMEKTRSVHIFLDSRHTMCSQFPLQLHCSSKDVPLRRVKRWGFDLRELLNDPVGHDQFTKFLEKEYSSENLK